MGSLGKVSCWLFCAASFVFGRTIDGELLGLTRGVTGTWSGTVSMRVAGKVEAFQTQHDFQRSNWEERRCWMIGARWRFTVADRHIASVRCGSINWVLHNRAVNAANQARALLMAIRTGRRDSAKALLPTSYVLTDSVWADWRAKLDADAGRPLPSEAGDSRCVTFHPPPEESIASPRAGCLDSGGPSWQDVGFTITREHGAIRLVPDFNWQW